MMRLYAPAIILFLWAMLAIAWADCAVFGAVGAITLTIAVPLSAAESFRAYERRRRG